MNYELYWNEQICISSYQIYLKLSKHIFLRCLIISQYVKHLFCVFWNFLTKKDVHWHFANICLIFIPWTPIWTEFVHFWMMSVPKQPALKLKSAVINMQSKHICKTTSFLTCKHTQDSKKILHNKCVEALAYPEMILIQRGLHVSHHTKHT